MSILGKEFRESLSGLIAQIEKKSGVEVVIAIASRSGNYSFVPILVGLIFAFFGISFSVFSDEELEDEFLVLIPLLFSAIGYLIFSFPLIHSILVPKKMKKRNSEIYARASFQKGNIYETVSRQGILIYVSVFEKEIIFLEDKFVTKRIPFDEIAKIKSSLNFVFKTFPDGKAPSRFISSIESMIPIFEKYIPVEPNDVNEIPDDLEIVL